MYLSVVTVKALSEYKLAITFENQEKRIFNVEPLLNKGVFQALQDESLFQQVGISFDTIQWIDKEGRTIDIAPETLYNKSVPL
jgi:hypothetical protein